MHRKKKQIAEHTCEPILAQHTEMSQIAYIVPDLLQNEMIRYLSPFYRQTEQKQKT